MEPLSRIDILDKSQNAGYRITGDWQKNSIEFLGRGQGGLLELKVKYPLLTWSELFSAQNLTIYISFTAVSDEMAGILRAFLQSLEKRNISVKIEWKYTEFYKDILPIARETVNGVPDFEVKIEQVDKLSGGLYPRFFEVWMNTPFYKTYMENYFEMNLHPDFYYKIAGNSLGLMVGYSQKANITFSGRLFGIKGIELWDPLNKWIDDLPSKCETKTVYIDFKLVFLSDTHAEILLRFLNRMEALVKSLDFQVFVDWYCNANDEEMLETGERLLNQLQVTKSRILTLPLVEAAMQPLSKIDIEKKSALTDYRIAGDATKAIIEFSGTGQGQWLDENIGLPVKQWIDSYLFDYHKKNLDFHLKFTQITGEMQKVLLGILEHIEKRIKDKEFLLNIHSYYDTQNAFLGFVAAQQMQFLKVSVFQVQRNADLPATLFPEKLETPYYGHFPPSLNGQESAPDFHISENLYTISADAQNGYITLSGTFGGDTFQNFTELNKWSELNLKAFKSKHINVFMRITYLDHSSRLSLKGIFRKHELLIKNEGFTASYYWSNPFGDEDLTEEAEIISYQCITSFWCSAEEDDEDIVSSVQESFKKGSGKCADFNYIEIPE